MTSVWLEIVSLLWLGVSLAGLGVNLYTLKDGKKDRYIAQHHIHKGTRLHVANTNIRRERVRAFIQILLFGVAVVSLNNPPPQSLFATRFVMVILGTLISLAQTGNSLVDAKDRIELLDLIDAQQLQSKYQIRNELMKEQAQAYLEKQRGRDR